MARDEDPLESLMNEPAPDDWQPLAPYGDGAEQEDELQPLHVIPATEWHGVEAPEREWAVTDWIPLKQATYLTGPGSAGKSLLGQQLATCLAFASPFFGLEVRQRPTFYVTCEDDADELHRRQKAICEAVRAPIQSLTNLNFVSLVGETGNELVTFDHEGRLSVAPRFRQIEAMIEPHRGAFIVLDNVAHFLTDEIRRSSVAGFMQLLNRLALRVGGAVLLLGHPNKAGDQFSGSTAWENQVRSRLYLESPKDEAGTILDPDRRVLSRSKSNYARNGETIEFRWYQGAFVRDEDLPPNMAEELRETAQENAANAAFLDCLRARIEQGRDVGPNPSSNYAPTQFEGMPEAKGLKKPALKRAMDRLYSAKQIETKVVRNASKGRDVTVIRETSQTTPNASPNASRTLSPDAPEADPERPRTHSTSTTYYTGAAHEAAAPDEAEGEERTVRPPNARFAGPGEGEE